MKKAIIIVFACVLGVAALGGFAVRSYRQGVAAKAKQTDVATVTKGELSVKVIETGTIEAVKTVELKSRVSGRIARLLVDEGDRVQAGQLIAIIDPQETELRVRQDRAQLKGAISGVNRQRLEIAQRRVTAQAAYRQAEARVAQLEAELKAQPILTRSGIEQAETSLNTALQEKERLASSAHPTARVSAETAMREADANYETARRELERQKGLLDRGFVSERSVESAQLQLDLARARQDSARENLRRLDAQMAAERAKAEDSVRQARAELARARANAVVDKVKGKELESAKAQLQTAKAELMDVELMAQSLRQSQANVEQIQASLGDSERQLRETELRAPIPGVVTKKLMQEGELVASLSSFSSGTPVVKIEDQRTMRVRLDVNEIDVAKLALGLPATVEIDAIPNQKFTGLVRKIAPASNPANQADAVVKYQVEVYLDGADPRLRSGMSAKCTVETLNRKNVLLLPLEYVGRDGQKRFVQIAPPEGSKEGTEPVRKDVVIGAQTGSKVEIVSGVREGDKVVRPKYSGPPRKGAMTFGPDEE